MKTCPRCYTKVDDDIYVCPECKFQLARIQQSSANTPIKKDGKTPAAPVQTPVATKKKKGLKKSEIMVILAVIAVFVVMLAVFNLPTPSTSRSSSKSSTSSGTTSQSVSKGSSSGASSSGTSSSGLQPVPTRYVYTVGEERTLVSDGNPIYFALKQVDMNAYLADGDAEGMQASGKLLVLEDGTKVALIKVLKTMAFVDVLDGDYAGETGYVELPYLQ